jgi:hypothetical protein
MRATAWKFLKICGVAVVVSAFFAYAKGPAAVPRRGQAPVPDTIFIGQFLTLDRSDPQTEAIAALGGRIAAMGSESEMEALANKNTRAIHIDGIALPGFADAHVHVAEVGAQLEKLNLRGLTKTAASSSTLTIRIPSRSILARMPNAWETTAG